VDIRRQGGDSSGGSGGNKESNWGLYVATHEGGLVGLDGSGKGRGMRGDNGKKEDVVRTSGGWPLVGDGERASSRFKGEEDGGKLGGWKQLESGVRATLAKRSV